jgi:hypothetical protein
LDEALALTVEGGNPGVVLWVDAEEIFIGAFDVCGVRDVGFIGSGERDAGDISFGEGGEGAVGGDEDPGAWGLGDSDVGPPVGREDMVVGIGQADLGEEEFGGRREVEIDLPGVALDAIVFVESQNGVALRGIDAGGEYGIAGVEMVTQEGRVPLDSAAEPCI